MHIGQQIKAIIEQKGMSKTELSRRLNMSSTNVHKIFKRSSIDTALLQQISDILQYNFFQFYGTPSFVTEEPAIQAFSPKSLSLEQLRRENEQLRQEVSYLKEINKLLREKQESGN